MDAAEWRADIARRLEQSKEFASAATAFDGALVFTVDASSTWFKIYAGRVLDVLPGKGVLGYTFELGATAADWREAFSQSRVGLQRLLSERKVQVSGNLLEFMRMAKAVDIFVEILREQYQDTTRGSTHAG